MIIDITTLRLEEFIVEKIICFFTREELTGMARDGYDLYAISKEYDWFYQIAKKVKPVIKKYVSTFNYNPSLFEKNIKQIENVIGSYLKKPVEIRLVNEFLTKLRGVMLE